MVTLGGILTRLGGSGERLEILKVSWNGWKIRNTEGLVARMQDR